MLSIHLTLRTLAERYVLPSTSKQVSQNQHRLVYEAILERDEKLARARMEKHLRMAYEVYRQAVPKSAGDPPAERSEHPSTDGPVDVSRPKVS
jgi:DNA-binding GntR family transcriptional regulator